MEGKGSFDDEIDDYLSGAGSPNLDMVGVEIVWVRDNPAFGSDHIAVNNVTEAEVEEVLFELPPEVEVKEHPVDKGKSIFWGATRSGRYLFISCEDWTESSIRYLKPITAFEPELGRDYWDQQ